MKTSCATGSSMSPTPSWCGLGMLNYGPPMRGGSCLDTRRPARLLGLMRSSAGHPCQDWKAFEPLIGHTPSVRARAGFGRVGRLKPAQIADLLEDASRTEGEITSSDPRPVQGCRRKGPGANGKGEVRQATEPASPFGIHVLMPVGCWSSPPLFKRSRGRTTRWFTFY